MGPDLVFNLSALAERLQQEKRKPEFAGKIASTVAARSIQVDLTLALEACEALAFSLDNPMNLPANFRETSEAALLAYVVLLYARATKSSSKVRSRYDPVPKFTDAEKKVHAELCDLRDHAIAHYGSGGSYNGNWAIEVAVLDVTGNVGRPAVVVRRTVVDRHLLRRARAQIARALEIIEPVFKTRMNALTDALLAEQKDDPEFFEELRAHPLNVAIFLGGKDQAESMMAGRGAGHARGSFGHE